MLHEIVEEFRLPRLYYSTAGVREGIIADLAHRKVGLAQARLNADRRRVVVALSRRYGLSAPHVRKVAQIAGILFEQLRSLHGLPAAHGQVIEAAAYLYNIGHWVNESRHHKHSLYLVANSDLRGFLGMGAAGHRQFVPLSSQVHAAAGASGVSGAGRRRAPRGGACWRRCCASPWRWIRARSNWSKTFTWRSRIRPWNCSCDRERDLDVEQWHAEQVAPVFRETYGLPLTVKIKR